MILVVRGSDDWYANMRIKSYSVNDDKVLYVFDDNDYILGMFDLSYVSAWYISKGKDKELENV